jgi:phosphatidylserine decarboxylase
MTDGRAFRAALKIVFWSLILLLAVLAGGVVARYLAYAISWLATTLVGIWVLFAAFTLYFFRDPNPEAPNIPNAIVAPAHGKVDLIDDTTEMEFVGGPCRRISIFLSVFDVHVQRAPLSGRIAYLRHTPGKFLSATRCDCALHNENTLIGIEPAAYPGKKVAVRQIAGLIARRILTWVEPGAKVPRGERIGLIQYGSRVEIFLPMDVKIHARLGDRVRGGETVIASFES